MNAIFYHGSGIEQVHNTSTCREKRSWIDAQIRKSNSLEVKDIYILFLQKNF